MGVSVIFDSGTIRIALKKLRNKNLEDISMLELYAAGIIVHLSMLALVSLLPGHFVIESLLKIGVPVIIIYAVGTALLGKLMSARISRDRIEESLRLTCS
jgi:hypothetical protein